MTGGEERSEEQKAADWLDKQAWTLAKAMFNEVKVILPWEKISAQERVAWYSAARFVLGKGPSS